MLRAAIIAAVLAAASPRIALSDDGILGNWRTQPGDTAAITSCGEAYCITLKDGQYSGRRIGRFSAAGAGSYNGSITNPEDGKTYNGSGTLAGNSLKMRGCVLGGLICKSQTWSRL